MLFSKCTQSVSQNSNNLRKAVLWSEKQWLLQYEMENTKILYSTFVVMGDKECKGHIKFFTPFGLISTFQKQTVLITIKKYHTFLESYKFFCFPVIKSLREFMPHSTWTKNCYTGSNQTQSPFLTICLTLSQRLWI